MLSKTIKILQTDKVDRQKVKQTDKQTSSFPEIKMFFFCRKTTLKNSITQSFCIKNSPSERKNFAELNNSLNNNKITLMNDLKTSDHEEEEKEHKHEKF